MNKRILLPVMFLGFWMGACDSTSGRGTTATGGSKAGGATGTNSGAGGMTETGGVKSSSEASVTGGAGGATDSRSATKSSSAKTGGTVTGGVTDPGGTTVSGGATATGGSSAAAGITATGGTTAGGGATTSGGTRTGGLATTGGSRATGGAVTGGTVTGGASTTGGSAGSTSKSPCKPIGWATRTGRTGSTFEVTGGGTVEPIVVKSFSDLKTYAADGQARVIHIDGTLGAGWSGSSGDRLEIKSNKTIVGLRPGTQLKAAIHIKGASNVILRNIVIRGPGSNEDQAWDNISIEGDSKNIWVDHCEFWDGQDGNADVVKGADTVTFTWNIFGYSLPGHPHNLSNLIASSDDEPESEGKLNITFMFNWWKGAMERQPRCRYGYIHVANNLYTSDSTVGASKLGVTNGYMCNVRTENNHFISQNDPIDLGKQAGTGSVQEANGNLFESCTGNQKGSGTAFTPPYEYKSSMLSASEVKALVQKGAGATLASPSACP
jgi:pectate lyase